MSRRKANRRKATRDVPRCGALASIGGEIYRCNRVEGHRDEAPSVFSTRARDDHACCAFHVWNDAEKMLIRTERTNAERAPANEPPIGE